MGFVCLHIPLHTTFNILQVTNNFNKRNNNNNNNNNNYHDFNGNSNKNDVDDDDGRRGANDNDNLYDYDAANGILSEKLPANRFDHVLTGLKPATLYACQVDGGGRRKKEKEKF